MTESSGWLRGVEGVLSGPDLTLTVERLAEWQLSDGMMPWYPGGHADPWNHVEALMALMLDGRKAEAEAGFAWLERLQHADGSWHQYYLAGGEVEEAKFDANCIAYVAAGLYHHWLLFEDRSFLDANWGMLSGAVDFVRGLQTDRGEVFWARKPDGTPFEFALLTGSSSITHSLRCAVAVAEVLGKERPEWVRSAQALGRVIRDEPDAFALDGWGIRCVSDRPWVTAAETCECAMAHLAVGETAAANQLFAWAQRLRNDDGHYWTGIVYPQEDYFPANETSTYSAAAVVLAADALSGASPASWLFAEHDRLPAGVPD